MLFQFFYIFYQKCHVYFFLDQGLPVFEPVKLVNHQVRN